MKTDIITIGDEILIGQIVNTNAAFLGEELTKLGFEVRQMLSIADREEAIINTLNDSIKNTDLVVITGGLGPTNDDITKQTLNAYFGGKLVLHKRSYELLEFFFKRRGLTISERNRKQAEVPDVCEVLINRVGTAPGMLFRKGSTLIVSLPGVPFEMVDLFEKELVPLIHRTWEMPVRLHTTVLTVGLSESYTADKIKTWEDQLEPNIRLAYLPSPGQLRLRISISGDNKDLLKKELNKKVSELVEYLGHENVFGTDKESLEEVVGSLLERTGNSLAIAESCTGGRLSELITSVSGASAYFKGSITAYSNEIKAQVLGVKQHDIDMHGAVSQEVVEQMASGVKKLMKTDYGLATSGIAGPTGGSDEKPVGTVWIAVATPKKIISKKYLFGNNRERNIVISSVIALNMLRNAVLNAE